MKDIIYLDTGVIHSFLAQHHNGLPTTTSKEQSEEIKDSNEKSTGYNSRTAVDTKLKTGSIDIPFLFKTPEGEINLSIQPGQFSSEKVAMSQTETGKEIISKQLHDNALEVFEKHLEKNDLVVNRWDDEIEGKFIKCVSTFKIIDFKYLNSIIQTETLVKFMFKQRQEEIDGLHGEVKKADKDRRAVLRAFITEAENKLKNESKSTREDMQFLEEALNYLKDVLPTEAFIIMDDVIVPLKSEHLRETAKELIFKYGEIGSSLRITMIGKVTREITTTAMPDFHNGNPFFEFPQILSGVLGSLGLINSGDLIVSPVAIYFE